MTDAVCGMMRNNEFISMREMSDRLGIGIGKLNGILNTLKADGIIERTGGRNGGKWIVRK